MSSPSSPTGDKAYSQRAARKLSNKRTTRQKSKSDTPEPGNLPKGTQHKRVWKACERCRMKKTKCDGFSPCKRCSDDGLICQAGNRKKTEYKQTPRGYAEVLEATNHALATTTQRLFNMVLNHEDWTHEHPGLNSDGDPIIHNIAKALGYTRTADTQYGFPEGPKDYEALADRLSKNFGMEEMETLKAEEEDDEMETHSPSHHHRTFSTESMNRKHSSDSMTVPPSLTHTDRASSIESSASNALSLESNSSYPAMQNPTPTKYPLQVHKQELYNTPMLQQPIPQPQSTRPHLSTNFSYANSQTLTATEPLVRNQSQSPFTTARWFSDSPSDQYLTSAVLQQSQDIDYNSHPSTLINQSSIISNRLRQAQEARQNMNSGFGFIKGLPDSPSSMSSMEYGGSNFGPMGDGTGTIKPTDLDMGYSSYSYGGNY